MSLKGLLFSVGFLTMFSTLLEYALIRAGSTAEQECKKLDA